MPRAEARTRFVADAMLGSLARKLRILGFDAAYYRAGDDTGILTLSAREDRVVLTSDKALAAQAASMGLEVFLITGSSDGARVSEIAEQAIEKGIELIAGASLCSLCGGSLSQVERKAAVNLVPPGVWRRHRLFFRCVRCGHVYWRGSHWKKLRSLARRLRAKQ